MLTTHARGSLRFLFGSRFAGTTILDRLILVTGNC